MNELDRPANVSTGLDPGLQAIRQGIAIANLDHLTPIALSGPGATAALTRHCTADLRIRDGRMRPSLLLDDRGLPIADLHLCRDDERFVLLAEGLSGAALTERLTDGAHADDLVLERLDQTHRIIGLTGPYAWELMAVLVGDEVVALPHGSFFRFDDWLCFRAGKTGEYAYDLLVPRARAEALRGRILDEGRRFDLVPADLFALDQAALESNVFNIRHEGRAGATPLELQLQWRLHNRAEYIGAAALRAQREAGIPRRTTAITSGGALAIGDPVQFEERRIGTVVNAGFSTARGDFVGIALLDRAYAHAGIDRYAAVHDGTRQPIATVSLPFINNRSLFIAPRKHRYADRDRDAFPPLS